MRLLYLRLPKDYPCHAKYKQTFFIIVRRALLIIVLHFSNLIVCFYSSCLLCSRHVGLLTAHWTIEACSSSLKLQYFGYLMWRTDLLVKTLMLGKIEGMRRKGWQRMRWLDGITGMQLMPLLSCFSGIPLPSSTILFSLVTISQTENTCTIPPSS